MKKKIGLILLALVMVIGALAACSPAADPPPPPPPAAVEPPTLPELPERAHGIDDPVTPEERALAAWEHYIELTGAFETGTPGAWAADFTMDMDLDISIMSMRLLTTGHSAAIVVDDDNMQFIMDLVIDMGIFGGEMTMVVYFSAVDGEMTMRMIVDGEEMPDAFIDLDMLDQMADSLAVPEFGLGDITSVEIEEDGNYTSFHFLLDVSAMNDFIQDAVGSQMGDLMDVFGGDADVRFELSDDMALTLVVYRSDDNPVSLVMDMDMRMVFEGVMFDELDGEEMTVRMITTFNYTAFGDDVVITTPPLGAPGAGIFDFMATADQLVGTWIWEDNNEFTIIFNSDFTGERNWTGQMEDFEWFAFGDELFIYSHDGFEEEWAFSISNGVLDFSSLQVPGLNFRYLAR